MFHDLGDVLGKGNAGIAPVANATSDAEALHTATKLVAESSGAVFSPQVAAGVDTRTGKEALVALARRADIRTREITLGQRWWRLDGPSFVANNVENGQPLAVLADGRGRYRSLDPTSRRTSEVDAGNAARIGHKGMMLYPPLPESVKTGLAALRHTLRGRWRDFRVVILMSVLAALLALLTPELTGKLLAEVIPRVDTPQWVAMLGALFLAALGTAMFDIVRALATLRIEGRIDEQLQTAVWSRLISLPMPFFRRYTSGDLADRANGITMIRQMLTGATVTSVLGGVFSLFSFALLFYYSWSLALWIGASALLILVGATWFFTKGQMRHHRAAFEVQGRIDGFVFQMLSGISKLRMANAERFALAKWAERFAEQRRETLAARRWMAGQMTFGTVFSPIAHPGHLRLHLVPAHRSGEAARFRPRGVPFLPRGVRAVHRRSDRSRHGLDDRGQRHSAVRACPADHRRPPGDGRQGHLAGGSRGRDRVRERLLPIPAGPPSRARRRLVPNRLERLRGLRRRLGLRKVDDLSPVARLRAADLGRGARRRPRPGEPRSSGAAHPPGRGAAERSAHARQHLQEHRRRFAADHGRSLGGGTVGRSRRGHPGHADGDAHIDSRGRERTVRGSEAAAAHCSGSRSQAAHPPARRGHERPRQPDPGHRPGVVARAQHHPPWSSPIDSARCRTRIAYTFWRGGGSWRAEATIT